jgi:hypothetical protein
LKEPPSNPVGIIEYGLYIPVRPELVEGPS